jgi:hypothetical protein
MVKKKVANVESRKNSQKIIARNSRQKIKKFNLKPNQIKPNLTKSNLTKPNLT